MKIGIIGGGITGLTAGYYLSRNGHEVIIFEKGAELGGLASSFNMAGNSLEKYYHHFFMSDKYLMGLVSELKLDDDVMINETEMGVFCDNMVHKFSTPVDIMRFSPFGLLDKIRFGLSIMKSRKSLNWKDIEGITAEEWIVRSSGKNVFDIIWEPLLESKFGSESDDISAAWLWGRIKARAESRSGAMVKERLCYIRGGFKKLVDALEGRIKGEDGKVIKKCIVKSIEKVNDGRLVVSASGNKHEFDAVISTVPIPSFLKIARNLPKHYTNSLDIIEYVGVVCMALELERPLGDIYWLNICDRNVPFGVLIEHTNFIDRSFYGGSSIAYISNYTSTKENIYKLGDDELLELYKKGLKRIFPDFDGSWIKRYSVFRDPYATPVYTRNYSKIIPKFETPVKGLFLANTSQIYPDDRNMSNSVKLGKEISEIVAKSGII